MKQYIMGNEAMAKGALEAGVKVVTGYPGTPATEIVDYCLPGEQVYVEWSANEKVALEMAMGASLCNMRSMAVMKHNGTNFATDFIMHLNFTGVRGGMVLVSADDPGANSSQNEEDTRILIHTYGHLPLFDPATPAEAKDMIKEAFALSEKTGSCYVLRPVMRICHSRAIIEDGAKEDLVQTPDFQSDRSRFVMSAVSEPKAGGLMRPMWRHRLLNEKQAEFTRYAEESRFNSVEEGEGRTGLVGCGIGYTCIKEAEALLNRKFPVLKLGTLPLPRKKVISFLRDLDVAIVFEEVEPVVERMLKQICYEEGLAVKILGREDYLPAEGELTPETVIEALRKQGLVEGGKTAVSAPQISALVRTRTQCVGCPHRGLLSALKQVARKKKAVVTGDIGCYDAGSFPPIELQSTIFCMGSSIPMASGIAKTGIDRPVMAIIGDSTFFHNGLLGLVNAVNNRSNITVILCDNSTTAMTGFQPHPGSGTNIYNEQTTAISPEKIGEALGIKTRVVNPYLMEETKAAVTEALEEEGVSLVISRAPCFLLSSRRGEKEIFPRRPVKMDPEKCNGCKVCLNDLGCPALHYVAGEKKVYVDFNNCVSCGLCADICRRGALSV
ncbi:MAG TPA: thiamine pyrophosphate-dependent enzyme [Bacillota bacterium]|nr:thiamine pyrophosphate-dependent enzyme [Bacillota bacterium]